ncbi:MAG: T9SS type A sorting domain-containing protein [Bacteroidetes bacterium]|nr:T9SS type A sorting domain-containing protein [Bacteroidota bacterium]
MKKTLLSILSLMSFAAFSQWQSTPQTFQGKDCAAAFGKLFTSGVSYNALDVSTDECVTFNPSNTGLTNGTRFGVVNAGVFYCFSGNNIYQSTTGNNWTVMASATATNDVVKAMTVINGTVLAVTNPVSGVSSKIFRLSGSNWVLHSSSASLIYTTIENLNGTLYAGTTATCVLKSNDAGLTFTNTSTGITPLTNFFDKYIVAFGATSSAIYCSTLGGRVFKSTNNGVSWAQTYYIGNGSSTIGISDFYTMSNGTLLTASDSGFVYTNNNGATWIKDNAGLTTTSGNYQIIKLDLTANYIVAADRNGTVMRKGLNQLSVGVKENNRVSVVSNVYPNPATDVVIIEANDLFSDSNCEVKITDVLGREVAIYNMTEGKTKINLQSYSSGIYTYRIYKSNTVLSTGKLIVN